MSDYGTHAGVKFAKTILKQFFEEAAAPKITNSDYEGQLTSGGADRVKILTFGKMTLKNYSGTSMGTPDNPTESEATFIVDQKKAYYFQIESLKKFFSYASDPQSSLIQMNKDILNEAVDAYILGFYGDVAAGNRVGTDYTTGTVTVTVTTGAVTGSGTTFTAAMVGKGFKAAGHTAWYRVKTYTSATAIVIEDDLDDETSAYTGGAIGAGATYTIEAVTPVQVSKTNIYGYIVDMGTKLNTSKVPKSQRTWTIPGVVAGVIRKSSDFTPAVAQAYEAVVKNGMIGRIGGFDVIENEQVSGDNTNGWHTIGNHKLWITMAIAFVESGVEDFIGGFGKNYKGLTVYGAKVPDVRRKCGAELFCYV
jgi:hypothetical protein